MKMRILLVALASLLGALVAPMDAIAQRYNDDKGRFGGWWWGRKGQSGLWEKLGTQSVGQGVDRDVIRVGARDGRFEAVKLRFHRNDVDLLRARIVFGNGESEDLGLKGRYRIGEETAVVRLQRGRQDGRFIREVELIYRDNPRRPVAAVVELWGMHDDDRDQRGRSVAIAPPQVRGPAWEMLGERSVDFRNDRDIIPVGRWEGTFRSLRLKVLKHDIELRDVTVVYANDAVDTWRINRRVRDEEEGPVFDLTGNRRAVKQIILRYRGTNPFGRTVVQVFGGR